MLTGKCRKKLSQQTADTLHIINYFNCVSSLQKPQKDNILQCFHATQSSTQNYPCESLLEECQIYLPFFATKSSEKDSKIAHFCIHSYTT